jgi:hypothetical protein
MPHLRLKNEDASMTKMSTVEFWYLCVADDLAAALQSCGAGSFAACRYGCFFK